MFADLLQFLGNLFVNKNICIIFAVEKNNKQD